MTSILIKRFVQFAPRILRQYTHTPCSYGPLQFAVFLLKNLSVLDLEVLHKVIVICSKDPTVRHRHTNDILVETLQVFVCAILKLQQLRIVCFINETCHGLVDHVGQFPSKGSTHIGEHAKLQLKQYL